jgi:molybdate transport system permease protein
VHLPLVIPPVVIGYLLLVALGRNGIVGAWLHEYLGLTLVFTWRGAAVAAGAMAFPLMVRTIRLSLESMDRRLETAARTLGARPLDVFLTVTLPLISPGIVAGVILSFARCLGEFGATITFASNVPGETRTLPLAIYSALQTPGGEAAVTRLAIIAVVVAVIALAASEILARRLARRIEA